MNKLHAKSLLFTALAATFALGLSVSAPKAEAAESEWFVTEGAKIRLISLPAPDGKTINTGGLDFSIEPEELVILNQPSTTLCSPRRWQKFGVLYVTWTNSKCVNLYSRGMTPDDLFQLYYGQPPPKRAHPNSSPWEIELQHTVKGPPRNSSASVST